MPQKIPASETHGGNKGGQPDFWPLNMAKTNFNSAGQIGDHIKKSINTSFVAQK